MSNFTLPEECAKQWEMLLLLLSSEEKRIDRTGDNEVEVMLYFYHNKGIRQIITQWLLQMNESYAKKRTDLATSTKCNEISLKWRQKGNESFKNNLIKESYNCYTKSVLYAEKEGPTFSLAFANRSASLLKLKKYKQCLSDIDLAIKYSYPVELRHKLYLRQADCYIEMHQVQLARKHLEIAQLHALELNLWPVHAAEFDRHLKVLEKKLQSLTNFNADKEEFQLPELLNGENENFVSASQAIELRRSEAAGRFVVAKEAAQRGDVLFKEEPYAFVTLPVKDDLAAICEGCCAGDINAVPCQTCSCAVYCSERCRDEAWIKFHQWECCGAQSNLFNTIGIAHLALRVVLVSASRGFPTPPNYNSKTKTDATQLLKIYSDCDNIEIYKKDTDAFYRMFNLVTNFDKMNNVDYVQYALTATMLALYLELYTSFFADLPSRLPFVLQEDELHIFVAALILRSMGQLVCNGHATLRLAVLDEEGSSKTQSEVEMRYATAIYPSAAMMNHSCDPNIINTFYKCQLIVRCSSELSPGSEVFNCYGPHRARETTVDRRSQLRAQYMFNCQCTSCMDTDRKDFFSLFSAYSCQSCKGPVTWSGKRISCSQCHQDFNIENALQTIGYANEMWDSAESESSWSCCERAHAALKLKQQVLHRHHSDLRQMADQLARVYVEIGEYTKSIELIKHNIQSIEYQYGSFSVEVANELRKLADVMLERIIHSPQHHDYRDWCLETHKIIKKAVQLMDLNYGSWEPLVIKLKEQEAAAAAMVAGNRTSEEVDCVHKQLHYNLKI